MQVRPKPTSSLDLYLPHMKRSYLKLYLMSSVGKHASVEKKVYLTVQKVALISYGSVNIMQLTLLFIELSFDTRKAFNTLTEEFAS